MSVIALLHPQCVRQGGAIQMALQTVGILQEQGHEVILYTFSHSPECFSELQKNLKIQKWGRESAGFFPGKKLISIITLAWHCRHVDIIIANNPPMQIVATFAKIFSLGHVKTIWWHHHIPWYLLAKSNLAYRQAGKQKAKSKNGDIVMKKIKGFFERHCIIPLIDEMVATSHFIAEQVRIYAGRESTVIHPIVDNRYKIIDKGGQGRILLDGRGADRGGGGGNNGKDDNGSDSLDSTLPTCLPDRQAGQAGPHSPSLADRLAGMTEPILLFSHGRLEPGKGAETLVNVYKRLEQKATSPTGRQESKKQSGKPVPVIAREEGTNFTPSEAIHPGSPISGSLRHNTPRDDGGIHLILFGTGSLEGILKKQGIDVRPFDTRSTLHDLASGHYGQHVLGIYCSEIDGFGMAPLESQMMGIPTVILDRAGSRETLVSNGVNSLVHNEDELFRSISHFVQFFSLPKCVSSVNFSHPKSYFFRPRLSLDLLNLMQKIKEEKSY